MGIGSSLLLLVGGLLSVQAAANVQLSRAVRSPVGAAALQLAIAAVLLVGASVLTGVAGVVPLVPGVPVGHLLGGLGSAVYITAGILLFPRLGAVVTVGLFIAGQLLASVVIDSFGLLDVPVSAVGIAELIGVLAVLGGAALIVRAQERVPIAAGTRTVGSTSGESETGPRWGWWALALLGGAVLPVQGALNAQLRADLDAPLPVAAWSFVLATAVMLVLLAVVAALRPGQRPQWTALGEVPWWGWLGGLVGAGYVTSVFLLLPQIGAAATIALTVAGQQLAGLAVDHFGLLRLPHRPVRAARLLGVLVLLAGVLLFQR
jgi:transporter family-2 protein